MHNDQFTDRQLMLNPYYEFFHYYDTIPPVINMHQHPFYEIFFFLNGDVTYNIEGRSYTLQPGDILLTNNSDIHRPEISQDKPYERIVIWLADTFFSSLTICGDDLSGCFIDASQKDYRLIRPDSENILQLKLLCEKISAARHSSQPGSSALSAAYLIQFLVRLSRCYYETPDSIVNDITENALVNRTVKYINDNITSDLPLDLLADEMHISKFYLSKKFKQYTGLSLYQYIMKKRLTISRNMLRTGMPVIEACTRCGFNDYSNYLKAFKREFGKNPRDCQHYQSF